MRRDCGQDWIANEGISICGDRNLIFFMTMDVSQREDKMRGSKNE